MAWRLASPHFAQALALWLAEEPFDVVQVEGIELARYLWPDRQHPSPTGTHPLTVFDDHNAEYVLQKRAFLTDIQHPRRWVAALYSLVQWLRLRRFERQVCQRADRLIAVSEADARALIALDPALKPVLVPNGVDLTTYHPNVAPHPGLSHPALVFTGKMDFRPNVDAVLWFSHEVLPRLWTRIPEAHFYIVGQSPSPRLDPLRGERRITITGHVDDVRPYIAAADVYVVPLRVGGGTRLKVLEAMAMGRALVSTRLGIEGLGASDGSELFVANDAEAFARRVLDLLRDEARRDTLGRAARAFVEQHYGWERIGPLLEAVYARPDDL